MLGHHSSILHVCPTSCVALAFLSLHYPGNPCVFSLGLKQISLELPPQNLNYLYEPIVVSPKKVGIYTVTQFQNRCFISCAIYLNFGILISQHFNNRNIHNSFTSANSWTPCLFPTMFSLHQFSIFFREHSLCNQLTSHLPLKQLTWRALLLAFGEYLLFVRHYYDSRH